MAVKEDYLQLRVQQPAGTEPRQPTMRRRAHLRVPLQVADVACPGDQRLELSKLLHGRGVEVGRIPIQLIVTLCEPVHRAVELVPSGLRSW